MYPGNSHYFSSQQVPQNAQLPSNYLQQLPQGYRSMQSAIQLQQSAIQQSTSYQTLTNPAVNASRLNSKPSGSQQRDQLQSLSSQNSPWLANGSLSMQRMAQTQQQADQRWQLQKDQQQLLQAERATFNPVQSNRTTIFSSPQNLSRSVMDFHTANMRQNQPNQLNAISQTLQQSQPSRVLSQRMQSPSAMTSSIGLLQSERFGQAQRQSVNRSVSVPSSNARLQAPNNVLHSPPVVPNQEFSSLFGHTVPNQTLSTLLEQATRQSMQCASSMQQKGSSQQPGKRDKIHIRFDQKSKQVCYGILTFI